jgi:hypothetical protein
VESDLPARDPAVADDLHTPTILPCEEVIGRWVADGSPTWPDEDGSG